MLRNARLLFIFFSVQLIRSSILKEQRDGLCSIIPDSSMCVSIGLKYYLIGGKTELSWFGAEKYCRSQNSFLVTIESANELRLISEYLMSMKSNDESNNRFWISGNDFDYKTIFFSFETGQLMPFALWSEGQPDDAHEDEHCVHLWKRPSGFAMKVGNCEMKANFICEIFSNVSIDIRSDVSHN